MTVKIIIDHTSPKISYTIVSASLKSGQQSYVTKGSVLRWIYANMCWDIQDKGHKWTTKNAVQFPFNSDLANSIFLKMIQGNLPSNDLYYQQLLKNQEYLRNKQNRNVTKKAVPKSEIQNLMEIIEKQNKAIEQLQSDVAKLKEEIKEREFVQVDVIPFTSDEKVNNKNTEEKINKENTEEKVNNKNTEEKVNNEEPEDFASLILKACQEGLDAESDSDEESDEELEPEEPEEKIHENKIMNILMKQEMEKPEKEEEEEEDGNHYYAGGTKQQFEKWELEHQKKIARMKAKQEEKEKETQERVARFRANASKSALGRAIRGKVRA